MFLPACPRWWGWRAAPGRQHPEISRSNPRSQACCARGPWAPAHMCRSKRRDCSDFHDHSDCRGCRDRLHSMAVVVASKRLRCGPGSGSESAGLLSGDSWMSRGRAPGTASAVTSLRMGLGSRTDRSSTTLGSLGVHCDDCGHCGQIDRGAQLAMVTAGARTQLGGLRHVENSDDARRSRCARSLEHHDQPVPRSPRRSRRLSLLCRKRLL
jgi:hypothetical protein